MPDVSSDLRCVRAAVPRVARGGRPVTVVALPTCFRCPKVTWALLCAECLKRYEDSRRRDGLCTGTPPMTDVPVQERSLHKKGESDDDRC